MTYKETLKYIFEAMPMYQRIGAAAYKADLENAYALDKYFQYPHKVFKTIHIAGTNGKGSVSHMIAAVLQSAGYKTGLFTSPHLIDFRERIKINGKEISKQYVIDFIEKYKDFFETIKPSFFEMSVFMAFDYFRQKNIDVAVIETGLGGRLDTTNIITPVLSVITNISKDHANILGNTIEQIAKEKAGIIKNSVPIIIGENQPETRNVFLEYAKRLNSKIVFADGHFRIDYQLRNSSGKSTYSFSLTGIPELNPLTCDLTGNYQKKNICTTLMSISALKSTDLEIETDNIQEGLANVINITGLKGRWQEMSYDPLVVCDTGHNEAGIREVMEQINNTAHRNLHMVLGFVADKDLNAIIGLLPKEAKYYLCEPDIPRAKKIEDLQKEFNFFSLHSEKFIKVVDAYKSAMRKASKDDMIFIGGSNFVVADFIKWKKLKKTF